MSNGTVRIVCPLEYERKLLMGAMKGRRNAEVECCGIGAARAAKWVEGVNAGTVVLAGLAASLTDGCPVRMAYLIREVQGEREGERWRCAALRDEWSQLPAANITSVEGVVGNRSERAKIQRERRVELADMESVAFVRAAEARGMKWMIVRGVSDSPSSPLPAGVEGLADEAGNARAMRAVMGMVKRPGSVGKMMKLRADSREAMRRAGELVGRVAARA